MDKAGAVRSKWRHSVGVTVFMLLIWGSIAVTSAKASVLPATITSNMTLNAAGSPYTGSPTIESGVTVQIGPGAVLNLGKITVKGTLKAEGTAEAPVIFTRGEVPGSWQNIKFEPGSGASILDHVEVRYGGSVNGTGGIEINGSSPTISHSVVSKNKTYGIRVSAGGAPDIAYNEITSNNSIGIVYETASTGEVNIHDNVVKSNLGAGISVGASGTNFGRSLGHNTVLSNGGNGISYGGSDIPPDISTNTLSENKYNQTVVQGTISQSATWTDPGYGFSMEAEITVASGATWTIKPGVYVEARRITVKGTLKAEGTAEAPVIFTRGEVPGSWQNIKFEPGSGASILDHVEVRYGGSVNGTGGIEINGSSPTISHSVVSKNKTYGIRVSAGGAPDIAYNEITSNNSIGIVYETASTGEVNIHDNVVKSNLGAGISVGASGTNFGRSLGHNTVLSNGGNGISYGGSDIPPDISENTLEANASDDIQVGGTVGHSSTWKLGGSPLRFIGTVLVPSGVTLTLQPGIYIRSPKMTVLGTLLAEGSAKRPVFLTGAGEEKGGEWGGINLEPGSGSSVLNYVELAYGGASGPMINVKGASPRITNSTLRRSSGDALRVQQSGQPIIEGNRFRNNQSGLRYEGEGKLSALHNDWGCSNIPGPMGCGDSVTSNVEWQPTAVLQELPRLCPGTTMSASSFQCLLPKYEPMLRYDSQESYFADDVRGIVENWGDVSGLWGIGELGQYSNRLFDKSYETGESNGLLIGESHPGGGGEFRLTLNLLGALYPNSLSADSDDWLDENDNYLADSEELEANGFMNSAYGYGSTDSEGKRWLQYWFWYYYNSHSYGGFGVHEGDWESVLIGLDSGNRPDTVVLSQHNGGARCTPEQLEATPEGAPIVFVGVDSHANFPRAGTFAAPFTLDSDHADGNGESAQPGLVLMNTYPPGWTAWPGHWGNSEGESGVESSSPQGPAFHEAWYAPQAYAEAAAECESGFESEEVPESFGAGAPSIESLSLQGRRPQVSYEVPRADGRGFWPRLRMSVNDLDDGGLPARSKTISNVRAHGAMTLPFPVESGHVVEVFGSLVYQDGRRIHLPPEKVRSP
jgi:hypothetical protein